MSSPWRRRGRAIRLRMLRPEGRDRPDDRRNGLAMALSLVIAAFLWFFFSMNDTYTIDVDVPIEIYGLPTNQALRERPPPSVRVTFQGEGWDLLPIVRDPSPVGIYAESPSVDVLEAVRESGKLPQGVLIQSASPRTVELVLDERIARLLPIRLVRSLDMAPSYGLLRPPRLSPDSVMISGARSIIGALASWPTQPLVRSGLRDSVDVSVPLSDTLDGLVVNKIPQATMVSLPIAAFTTGTRILEVRVQNVPAGVTAVRTDPAQVRVTYTVPAERRADERARTDPEFVAVADYADILRGAETVPLSVQIPPDLDVRDPSLTVQRVEYFIVIDTPPAPESVE